MARSLAERVTEAVEAAMPLAEHLFDKLREKTSDGVGITRGSYSPGEQVAHDLMTEAARGLGLEIDLDPAGNLYMTLPGADRSAPAWFVGSHLDSVSCGGNYDGAAGVVAGLAAVDGLRRIGLTPERDVTVMGIRAEECSTWFAGHHGGHLGSRAVLGLLWPGEMASAVHVESGKTLAECMDAAGFDSQYFERGETYLEAARIHGYFELHIEQGPVLEQRGIPVGVVTAIRGCLRARSGQTRGVYTHSGAVPFELRQDAVLATAEFVHAIDCKWSEMRETGADMVYTVGKFFTDAEHHSVVKVPGQVGFGLDIRSQDAQTLEHMREFVTRQAEEIGARRNVQIDPGETSLVTPAVMDAGFCAHLQRGCAELEIPYMDIPSGAGHDAADFHDVGVPTAMIFVRNAYGSHNPDEAMEIDDFHLGTRLLAWTLATAD